MESVVHLRLYDELMQEQAKDYSSLRIQLTAAVLIGGFACQWLAATARNGACPGRGEEWFNMMSLFIFINFVLLPRWWFAETGRFPMRNMRLSRWFGVPRSRTSRMLQ